MSPVLSLDFGGAFTKVALRCTSDQPSDLISEESLNLDEFHFCIPTIAARAERGGGVRWKCGIEAVGLRDSDGIRVFRQLKEGLFAASQSSAANNAQGPDKVEDFLDELDTLAAERKQLIREIARAKHLSPAEVRQLVRKRRLRIDELRQIARRLRESSLTAPPLDAANREALVEYFRWLQQFLERPCRAHGIFDLARVPLRVGVPALGATSAEQTLLDILREAGWSPANERPVVLEPFANLVGTLTAGVNEHWLPAAPGRTGPLREQARFGLIVEALRKRCLVLAGQRTRHNVLIVDIGAYTTDLSLLRLELGDSFTAPQARTACSPLGINSLDRDILALLDEPHARYVAALDSLRLEELKRRLYGDMMPYATPVGDIGAGDEGDRVHEGIRWFGLRLAKAADRFLVNENTDAVHELILTGGGSLVPLLRTTILECLSSRGIEVVHLPLRNGEPTGVRQHRLDARLARGASALGGASLFFDALASGVN